MHHVAFMPAYRTKLLQINLRQVVIERILVISNFYCLQLIIIIIIIIYNNRNRISLKNINKSNIPIRCMSITYHMVHSINYCLVFPFLHSFYCLSLSSVLRSSI